MRLLYLFVPPFLATFLFWGLLTRSHSASAGTAVRMDVGEMTLGAELVVEAQILSALAQERADGRIDTEYVLRVERTFVGDDEPYRLVRIPGGLLADGRGLLLPGMPRIRTGERTLLFLTGEGLDGTRMPVGLTQGKFTLVARRDGGKLLVRDAGAAARIERSGRPVVTQGREVLDYADVIAQIEAARAR